MLTRIIDRDNCLTPELTLYAERRLLFALSRFDSKILSIVLKVEDTNGPRGGVDKKCQLRIKLRRCQEIIVSDTNDDLEKCLSRLADRAGRTVSRQLNKMNDVYRRRVPMRVDEGLSLFPG